MLALRHLVLCLKSSLALGQGFPDSSAGEEIGYPLQYSWGSLVPQLVKNPPAIWETWVQSLGWGEGKGYTLQYSSLQSSTDCTVHGVTKRLSQHKPWEQHALPLLQKALLCFDYPVAADIRRDSVKVLLVFIPGIRKPHFVNGFQPNHVNVYYHRYLISVSSVINRYLTMHLDVRQGTSCHCRLKGETAGEVLMEMLPSLQTGVEKPKTNQHI